MTIDARELGGLTKNAVYVYNSSSTFTTPAVMPSLVAYITATAGSGSGANAATGGHASGGNSGEYCIRFPVVLAPSTTYTIIVGSFGAGLGTSAISDGNDGGDTSFGTLLVLKGGKGGGTLPGGATIAQIVNYQSKRGGVCSARAIVPLAGSVSLTGLTLAQGLAGNQHGAAAWDAADASLATGGAPGLFGSGTDSSTTATTSAAPANSGAGSGATAGTTAGTGNGASGKLILEIEEFL